MSSASSSPASLGIVLLLLAAGARAQFTAESIGTGPIINDMNDAGQVVGHTLSLSPQPYLAGPNHPEQLLPMPPGFNIGNAEGINDYGVVVGWVASNGLSTQTAAAWAPDANGVYTVQLLASPGQTKSAAYAINNRGDIIGVTIAPVSVRTGVWFNSPTGLLDISALGASIVPQQVNNHGVVVGYSGLFDLDTLQQVPMPPLPPGWTAFRAYAINDHGELGGLAEQGSLSAAAVWTAAFGWQVVGALASFASSNDGIYDIADSGLAIGGSQHWVGGTELVVRLPDATVLMGSSLPGSFSALYGGAVDDTGRIAVHESTPSSSGLVLLTPVGCQDNLGSQGPGPLAASLCGAGLAAGQSSDYLVTGAPANTIGALLVSIDGNANAPIFGGNLVSFGGFFLALPLAADGIGDARMAIGGAPSPGVDFVLQAACVDPSVAQGLTFSNAIRARLGQ